MPVIGHAFVGLATAMVAAPRGGIGRRGFLWVPTVVALAYLPDIVSQTLSLAGVQGWRHVAHSVVLSLPIAAVLAPVLAGLFGLSRLRVFGVAAASVLLHCGLDALFGGKYMFLWPLSSERETFLPPHELGKPLELLVFPPAFVLFYIGWRWFRRGDGRGRAGLWPGASRGERWAAAALTAVILFAATATYGLGLLRKHQVARVSKLLNQNRYGEALHQLDLASQWPAGYRPAQELCIRGTIYMRMGHRARAEECWLESHAADPSYYWTILLLARFYANADAPLEWRREKAAPFMEQLRLKIPIKPGARRNWESLAGKLEWRPASAPASQAGQ